LKNIKLTLLAHCPHNSIGDKNTPSGYDGHPSEEGIKTAKKLVLPEFDKIFCTRKFRTTGTASVIGLQDAIELITISSDEEMINDEAGTVNRFKVALKTIYKKCRDGDNVLIILSRQDVVAAQWLCHSVSQKKEYLDKIGGFTQYMYSIWVESTVQGNSIQSATQLLPQKFIFDGKKINRTTN